MIPKIIHYCWLSNDPIPADLLKYIDTWKEKLPDYKIMKWDFSVFEKSSSAWVSQAFDNKKYAFAADFIRLYAVYHYGGIYLDSDVEVLKSFDPYLQLPTMIGWQYNKDGLEVAAFGAEKEQAWIGDCLDYYKDRTFVKSDGSFDQKTLPLIVEDVLKSHHYQLIDVHNIQEAEEVKGEKDIPVFTTDYFREHGLHTSLCSIMDFPHSQIYPQNGTTHWWSQAKKIRIENICSYTQVMTCKKSHRFFPDILS